MGGEGGGADVLGGFREGLEPGLCKVLFGALRCTGTRGWGTLTLPYSLLPPNNPFILWPGVGLGVCWCAQFLAGSGEWVWADRENPTFPVGNGMHKRVLKGLGGAQHVSKCPCHEPCLSLECPMAVRLVPANKFFIAEAGVQADEFQAVVNVALTSSLTFGAATIMAESQLLSETCCQCGGGPASKSCFYPLCVPLCF